MSNDDFKGFPDHPLLGATRAAYRQWLGIPEVHIMADLLAANEQNKTPDQLRHEWSMQGVPDPYKYDNGVDWEAPEPPSGDAGLTVVELKDE